MIRAGSGDTRNGPDSAAGVHVLVSELVAHEKFRPDSSRISSGTARRKSTGLGMFRRESLTRFTVYFVVRDNHWHVVGVEWSSEAGSGLGEVDAQRCSPLIMIKLQGGTHQSVVVSEAQATARV